MPEKKMLSDYPLLVEEWDYDKNMTERELAALNGISRIWDCGKTKYVKKI